MKRPSVVVFDLGKVLLDFDYSVAARRLAALSRVSAEEIQRFIDQSPLLVRYEKGLISRGEFFAAVRHMSGCRCTLEEFGGLFGDVFSPIEPMIQLQQELKRAGVPTYIFSNTNDLAIAHIRKAYPFFAGFAGYVLSYEHGAMKPEAALYDAVEARSGQQGPAILYLDDRKENVEAGRTRGWQALLHKSPEASWAMVQSLGLVSP